MRLICESMVETVQWELQKHSWGKPHLTVHRHDQGLGNSRSTRNLADFEWLTQRFISRISWWCHEDKSSSGLHDRGPNDLWVFEAGRLQSDARRAGPVRREQNKAQLNRTRIFLRLHPMLALWSPRGYFCGAPVHLSSSVHREGP